MTQLGRVGVAVGGTVTGEEAREVERLGYGTLWVAGSPAAELAFAEPILAQTATLRLATGIVNVWTAAAKDVAESFHRIEAAYPGRFLLGIGVGHPEHTAEYRKPYDAVVDYLDELDAAGVPAHRRVLAALGPRMLELAARRSAGAHPALTTPEHTALARKTLGSEALLAPSQLVSINPDPDASRTIGRQMIGNYLGTVNYASSWRRLGFTDDDLAPPGSDRLIDALLAHGTAEAVAKRVNEHLGAGADHVAVLSPDPAKLMSTLAELAGPLGLSA
ncbi:MAG: F420-dependent oxidoreductase [Mycobacterium sp.]|nr:F420-dependent oxidoreductase [Mycobacterium sp.]